MTKAFTDIRYFKTSTRSVYEKKNAIYYFHISIFACSRDIGTFLRYANYPSDDVIYLTNI